MAKKPKPPVKKTGRGKIMNAKAAQEEAARAAAEKAEAETLRMPEESFLGRLLSRVNSLRKQSRVASGQAGEMIGQAVEKNSLDRKAFAIARQLADMEDAKLRITYRHLMKYLDDLGVAKRATAQIEMFDQDGEENEQDEAEQGGDGKVVTLNTGAREVAEAAGA